jgi:hypothetical protein
MKSEQAAAGNTNRPEKRSVEEWVSEIDKLIGNQKRTVFEIGDLLIRAEEDLSKKNFGVAVKASGLKSRQNANNYMRVARAQHLRQPEIFKHLPTCVGALIDLAAWTDREIQFGLRDGVIHSQCERTKLQKWRAMFNYGGPAPPPPKARVVAYIMCDVATYDFGRAYELWDKFDEMKLKCLPDDMHITPYDDDLHSQHRLEQLAKRVWAAYVKDSALFVDPRFQKLVQDKQIQGDGAWLYLKEIATIIASGDHTPLHKVLKFSKSDWTFLGVSDPGYATLLAYLQQRTGNLA